MALNVNSLLESPIIDLDSIDSTNNYAMRLIDADTAQPGMTIVAGRQTHGKGQRGRQWEDTPGQSLLMSIIIAPNRSIDEQFIFNAAVSVAIADALQALYENWHIRIKWPNYIIVNDKKAGGLLIENIIRGSDWSYSIVGLGLNILQTEFPHELPNATSLKIVSGKDFTIAELKDTIRRNILEYTTVKKDANTIMEQYNEYLFKKGNEQFFYDSRSEWKAVIESAQKDGTLRVMQGDGSISHYTHGVVTWKW